MASQTDDKLNKFFIGGHRGMGQNFPPMETAVGDEHRQKSIRENTILSFNRAAATGIDFVEFDVQVTRDNVPVLFHDNLILTDDGAVNKISDLSLVQFSSIGPYSASFSGEYGKKLLRKNQYGEIYPWEVEEEDAMPTLAQVFECVDPRIGFNIEIKFSSNHSRDIDDAEVKRMLDPILEVVRLHEGSRKVFFSSFMPQAVIELKRRAVPQEVFFLTVGRDYTDDPRMTSVASAIQLCKSHELAGVVSDVEALLKDSSAAPSVRAAGLQLFTYGSLNNKLEIIRAEKTAGVQGVIVDCVSEICRGLRSGSFG